MARYHNFGYHTTINHPVEGSDDVIEKLFQNLTLTPEEIEELPEVYSKLYHERLQNRRNQRLGEENLLLKRIKRKLKARKQLDYSEEELLEHRSLKVSSIKSAVVEVDAVDLLEDIVNGDYTLQDVHLVREGPDAVEHKDAVENSPLQLLDSVIDSAKEQTHEALQTKQPGQFFGSLTDEFTGSMKSSQIDDAINQAATAIDLVQGNNFKDNEAQEALNSFIKALALNEAEIKLKQLDDLAIESQAQHEKMAEAAAAAGLICDDADPTPAAPNLSKKHFFDVSELNYDISFLPSNDPDVYKPLEVISYIGMTKSVP